MTVTQNSHATFNGRVLVLGGTGQTGRRIAAGSAAKGIPVRLARDRVLDAADRGPCVVLGVEGERVLRDVEAADEIGGRVDGGSRSYDLEHEGLSEAGEWNQGPESV